MPGFSIEPVVEKLGKIRTPLKKLIHNITDSDYLSNHRRIQSKKKLEATLLFVEGTVSAIMMLYKDNGSLIQWLHLLLWYCRWSLSRWSISSIYIYNLPRLCTTRVNRSDKKWFHTLKGKKQTISRRNYYKCTLCKLSSASFKYTYASQIPTPLPGAGNKKLWSRHKRKLHRVHVF